MSDVANEEMSEGIRLGDSLRHRRQRPGAGAILVSLGVHGAAVGLFFVSGMQLKRDSMEFVPIAIHLVSPAPTVLGEAQPVETTSAVVTAPKVETKKAEPVVKPKVQTQSATDSKVVSKSTSKPAAGANPKPGPVGGEGLNINQDGAPFLYPDYLNGVIRRLQSYFRWSGPANLTVEVEFFIRRDGSTGGVEVLKPSGNLAFDRAATAAIENVGKAMVLGALPRAWQGDRLTIRYTFVPPDN